MTAIGYEIRIAGPVPDALLEELEGVHVTVEPVTTMLRGPAADQSALHGIINRLQGLGLELLEVRRLPPESPGVGIETAE